MKLPRTLTLAAALGMVSLQAAAVCPGSSQCVRPSGCPPGAFPLGPPPGGVGSMLILQNAIELAKKGTVFCVAPGTYIGGLNFKGKAVTLLSKGGPGVTVLAGNGGTVVTFNSFEGANSVLDGFTIENGRSVNGGGGLLISSASPTIRNCIVKGNSATGGPHPRGGGAHVTGSSAAPSITCIRFEGNQADFAGGGLATTYFAHPYLGYDTFVNNQAGFGGALAGHYNGRATIEDSEFVNNSAIDGGAIHLGTPFGNATLRRTVIAHNTGAGAGGGLWVAAGFADVLNCVFDGNQALSGGAAAAGFGSMVNVASTIFVNNSTIGGGGALTSQPDSAGDNTTVVNNFNAFFNNAGGSYSNTLSNHGLLSADPKLDANACYVLKAGSPCLDAGIPNFHFNDANGTRNDMGVYGGK